MYTLQSMVTTTFTCMLGVGVIRVFSTYIHFIYLFIIFLGFSRVMTRHAPHLLPLGLRHVPLHQVGDLSLQLPASKIVAGH